MRSSGCARQRDPARERVARVRVHAEVLPARARRASRRRRRSRRNGIGAREKYSARPSSAVTTFTTFGSAEDGAPARRPRRCRARNRAVAASRSAPRTASADTNGSSPCTFTMTSKLANSRLPRDLGDAIGAGGMVGDREDDIGAALDAPRPRLPRCPSRRRSDPRRPWLTTRSQTRTTSGRPARRRSGLRGRRVAPRRAGMTASVFIPRAGRYVRARPTRIGNVGVGA